MDEVDVFTACDVVKEDNTDAVPVEYAIVLFDVNGDDVSNNEDDNSDDIILEEGDDVKCNDEDTSRLDDKLSVNLVVMVTKLGLVIMAEVTTFEKVLLTDVAVVFTEESVTCDEEITGSEESNVLRTDENEDENLTVDGCCEDESAVAILLVNTGTVDISDVVGDDVDCEVLVLVLTWCHDMGAEDSTRLAVETGE